MLSSSRPGAGARLWNSASAISAAAPPPTPLNSATICGIAVIFTRRAPTAPIDAADRHRDRDPDVALQARWASVTTIASAMPAAPTWLPSRARRGLERNRSARMKVTIVTR